MARATRGSNRARLTQRSASEPPSRATIAYSLAILNGVCPTPSTKQAGKIRQRKTQARSRAVAAP